MTEPISPNQERARQSTPPSGLSTTPPPLLDATPASDIKQPVQCAEGSQASDPAKKKKKKSLSGSERSKLEKWSWKGAGYGPPACTAQYNRKELLLEIKDGINQGGPPSWYRAVNFPATTVHSDCDPRRLVVVL